MVAQNETTLALIEQRFAGTNWVPVSVPDNPDRLVENLRAASVITAVLNRTQPSTLVRQIRAAELLAFEHDVVVPLFCILEHPEAGNVMHLLWAGATRVLAKSSNGATLTRAAAAWQRATTSVEGAKVLVVDDSHLEDALAGIGITVLSAKDGRTHRSWSNLAQWMALTSWCQTWVWRECLEMNFVLSYRRMREPSKFQSSY